MKNLAIDKKVVALIVALIAITLIGIRANACELNCQECMRVERTQVLRNGYYDMLMTKEEIGHFEVILTDDGFQLISRGDSTSKAFVNYDMMHHRVDAYLDGEHESIEEWDYDDYLDWTEE